MSSSTNRYRLSCNYEFLNKNYDLKINFIRDLSKINYCNNKLFNIIDKKIIVNDNTEDGIEVENFNMGEDENLLNITKFIYNNSTIMILHRIFRDDENYSVFYASKVTPTLNAFLKDL